MIAANRATGALLAAMLALAGCAASDAPAPAEPAAPPPPAGAADAACDASMLTDLVGQTASEALAADAMKRSGSRSMRWLSPGMAVTMDFRADRLNIELDAKNKVVGSRCG